ncbi:MAG: mechanosensitive ion channel domain-containing protein [Pseudomonadota bacterium]
MPNSPEIYPLLLELWTDLQNVRTLWQVAIVIASLLAAWLAGKLIRPRLITPDGGRALGREALSQLQFPLTALVLVLIGRLILRQWQPVHMLNVAVPLLFSFAIVRVAVLMLRQAFAPSGWIDAMGRLIGWVVWIGFALHVTGLASDLLQFLDDLDFSIGKKRISLLLILQGALSVLVTLLLAMWLGRFIEARLMGAHTLNINLRVMFSKLAQALLIFATILIALPAVGIDVTVLSVFGGMLGVGIGFGLQKIASNYISGFIILMDRSVGIGDLITVDNHTGQLIKMTARYVVVRSLGGLEAIIPNETIITSTVLNHSYTDRRVRVAVPLQVSYRSDLDVAMRIMVNAAKNQKRVLQDPAPGALILQFADSGIDLELGVWIDDPQEGTAGLRSDLYIEIWREFRKNGIEIPYPQREVRLLGVQPISAAKDS